jgi:enamine deaminase RidA (YjgF/YER057c/UK114 family)
MSVRLLNPATLAEAKGFSHVAVGKGAPVVLAGQIGWDKTGKVVSADLVEQFALALDNMVEALRAAGGKPTDLALLRIYCTRVPEYRARLKELGVTELFMPGTWIEIEGLAYVEAGGAPGA